jgi:hypothetical protein
VEPRLQVSDQLLFAIARPALVFADPKRERYFASLYSIVNGAMMTLTSIAQDEVMDGGTGQNHLHFWA